MRSVHDNISASFTKDEKKHVIKAAKKAGVTTSKYVHDAVMNRMDSDQ